MKKHKFFAALTAAVVALSSMTAFPSAAFAAEKQKTYTYDPEFGETVEMNTEDYTSTQEYTFDFWAIRDDIIESIDDDFPEDSLKISKIFIDYAVEGEPTEFIVDVHGGGEDSDGNEVKFGGDSDIEPLKYTGKTGTIATTDAQFADTGIEIYGWLDVVASGKGEGNLTLSITKVEVELSYDTVENITVTGTEKYTFSDDHIKNSLDGNLVYTVGYEPYEEDFCIGYWIAENPEQFNGISTIGDFVGKYGSLEMKFKAEDIQGDAEVYAMLEVGDDSKGEYQQIVLPAQDVAEGQNVYIVDFNGNIKSAYSAFRSVSVHFRSKTEDTTAKFTLGLYNSTTITATGTETFKNDLTTDEDITVSIGVPEWWNPELGPRYEESIDVWNFGMGGEPNTCLADTVPELYSTYKGGEITFNVKGLSADVTYQVVLATRVGNDFGENIVLSDNNTLRSGANTVKFDLPKTTYSNPDILALVLRFSAEAETEFTIGAPEPSTPVTPVTPSTPSTSEPATSEPSASTPADTNTDEVFKTEEKPIKDIMEEVKPDTTASVEVAAKDTTIKADVFEAAKEKKVTLELKLENGVKWEIKAETIGNGAADVNINVELNTTNVPAASVEAVAEGKSTMQISLAHDGSFGFEANITIPVASANNGKVANLFHFNNGALEFVASATVINGEATLPFSHASEYVIVFNEKSMGSSADTSNTTSAPETGTNPSTGAAGVGIFAALAAVSAAAVIVCRKNKHD